MRDAADSGDNLPFTRVSRAPMESAISVSRARGVSIHPPNSAPLDLGDRLVRRISTAGGFSPRWRHDGTQIFYLALDKTLMAATVNGLRASSRSPADPA
ncbi:MAG TPA: hypothetical protein VNZ26_32125 [Vicinamibacterales bacterium]|jgi:hypothetical protein|nr:hypothetical protein [Vicinamibacterales bacterium]